MKVFGYKDKYEYYKDCSTKKYLSKIRVPSIVINAKDDPFVDELTLPTEDDLEDAPVRLIYHNNGGHCGFMIDEAFYINIPQHGFIADEMGRALLHIHSNRRK